MTIHVGPVEVIVVIIWLALLIVGHKIAPDP